MDFGLLDRRAREAERYAKNAAIRDEYGPVQSALIGAGREFTRIGRGAADLALGAADLVAGDGTDLQSWINRQRGEAAQADAAEREIMRPLEQARPYSTGLGTALPYLATAPLGIEAGLARSAGIGAGEGFIGYEDSMVDRVANSVAGAAGGALGYGAGRLANRVASNVQKFSKAVREGKQPPAKLTSETTGEIDTTGQIDAELKFAGEGKLISARDRVNKLITEADQASGQRGKHIETLDVEGYKVTPAQRTDSAVARNLENRLSRNSAFSEEFIRYKDHNQKKLNGTVAEALGMPRTDNLGQDFLGEVLDKNSEAFRHISEAARPLKLQNAEKKELLDIALNGVGGIAPDPVAQGIAKRTLQIMSDHGGELPSQIYVSQRSIITKGMRGADALTREGLDRILTVYDDAFARSNPGLKEPIRRAREQYRIWALLSKGRALTDEGNVNLRTFSGNLRREMMKEYRAGKVEGLQPETQQMLKEIMALNQIGDVVPTSGTMENASMTALESLGNVAARLTGNIASKGYMKAGTKGVAALEGVQQIPLKQLFTNDPLSQGLLEAYSAATGTGIGISGE